MSLSPFGDGDPSGGAVLLDPDETVVGAAYARLSPIVDRLTVAPFDDAAYEAMRDYLDTQAGAAAAAYARLSRRAPADLAARTAQIDAAALTIGSGQSTPRDPA